MFLSLIAKITVYFQTAPRCGELAEHPHRTKGQKLRERERERNIQGRKERK